MLEVKNLSVQYGAHPALDDVGLSVDFGEIVVILGANGAGKSSLLKAIAGTSEGTVSGQVLLDGAELSGAGPDWIVESGIAFVPEGRGVFGDLTAAENLALGAYSKHARTSQSANLAKVYELFPKLRERSGQVVRTMSGGEQQMVAIGRAMMSDPKILMLDEPSLGLSPLLCKELFSNLAKVCESGIGVLMVEQNAKQSLAIADRGYLIENGSITGQNDAQAMLNDPAVQAAYLGGAVAKAAPPAVSGAAHTANQDNGQAARTFISPGALSQSDLAPVSDDAIASMVAKAAESGHSTLPSTPRPPHETAHQKTRVVEEGTSLAPQSSQPNGQDPELQALLHSMEEAARRARTGDPSPPDNSATQPVAPPEVEESLPTIPVYKKTRLEVYRRASDGTMQRVKR